MTDNDTSDEAAREVLMRRIRNYDPTNNKACERISFYGGWREAVRRCEARMEDFRKEANETYRQNEIKWINIVSKLRIEMEERDRKAFEAGYQMRKKLPPLTPDEAYRAFKEAQALNR